MKTIQTIIMRMVCTILFISMNACTLYPGSNPEDTPSMIFEELWSNFDETYALFEIKGIDWDAVHVEYRRSIHDGMNDRELFLVCSQMLSVLNDRHVNFMSPFACSNSGSMHESSEAFSLELLKQEYLQDIRNAGYGMFTYGRLRSDPTVGYLYIAGFAVGNSGLNQMQDWASDIDIIIRDLSDTKALILDVRGNRGGLTGNVVRVSSRLAREHRVYAYSRTKNGKGPNDFSQPVELEIKPEGSIRYTRPIFMLTNNETISAGEYFTMAMASQSHVTHVGSGTSGAFSLSLERPLPNGWRFTVSVQQLRRPDGSCPENTGIVPAEEHCVVNSSEDLDAGIDAQFEHALGLAVLQ